jgi:hypothetical protein
MWVAVYRSFDILPALKEEEDVKLDLLARANRNVEPFWASKCERGERKPSGGILKLLSLKGYPR